MITKHLLRGSVFCLFILFTRTLPLDDHFVRASWSPTEPRFERKNLQTIEIPVRYGSTDSAYNYHGHKTNLFNLYGTHALAQASKGANLNASNATDKLFIDLTQEAETITKSDPSFGTLSFSGKEKLTECFFTLEQNFQHGIFLAAYIPLRCVESSHVQWHDLTDPHSTTPTWTTIKESLPELLADRYNLCISPCNKITVLCDGYLLGGWTYNNEDTLSFDYIDTTLQAGVLIPDTKSSFRASNPFTLYPSSNGHIGFPLRAAISGGLFEWLTLGGSFDATFFAPKNQSLRLKTAPEQSGLIILTTDSAQVKQGPIWNASTYFKIDHIGKAFSLLLGYSYAKKTSDTVSPCNKDLSCSMINSDPRFRGWNMHTLHLKSEYDFSQEDKRFGPRIGLFYDKILAGESIVNNSMGGGLFGLEIALDLP